MAMPTVGGRCAVPIRGDGVALRRPSGRLSVPTTMYSTLAQAQIHAAGRASDTTWHLCAQGKKPHICSSRMVDDSTPLILNFHEHTHMAVRPT